MTDETSKKNDRIIIWLTALGLLVGVAAVTIEAADLFDRQPRKQAETSDASDVSGGDFGPRTGIGIATLSADTFAGAFDAGLEGEPQVSERPRSGEWRTALCAGDVIIEIDGMVPADGAEAIEGQLEAATTALVRPRAKLAEPPGPESSLSVRRGETRRC